MGLERPDQLVAFCLELSSEKPSPGGGTASAAAGAMAASLLIMVCGITARSKRHEAARPKLAKHREVLVRIRDDLIRLAAEDAAAYDLVVEAIQKRKEEPGEEAERRVQEAFVRAAEVPSSTAEACLKVMSIGSEVATLGTRSATSDTGAAILLAEAGFKGAAMNVRINVKYISDEAYVAAAEKELELREEESESTVKAALEALH